MSAPTLARPTPDPDLDPWELVAAAQGGDREAFGGLYERYARVVFRVVLSRVRDHSLAEDLTSETFLRALRGIEGVSEQGRVGAWLVTIAGNLVRDHYKSSRYQRERLIPPPADELDVSYPWGPAARAPDPEGTAIVAAEVEELERELVRLSPLQRECLRLRFLAGLSVSEAASVMGRTEGAVKSLQHRAVGALALSLREWVAR